MDRPSGDFKSYDVMPILLRKRLEPIKPVIDLLFKRGLVIHVMQPGIESVRDGGFLLPQFWDGPAVYIQWIKTLVMSHSIAYGYNEGYGTFRGDVHEIGHAFWYLLLTTDERWGTLYGMWRIRLASGKLLDDYSATKAEEWFAQCFEAILTDEKDDSGFNWCREDLVQLDYEMYTWLYKRLQGLGVDLSRYI